MVDNDFSQAVLRVRNLLEQQETKHPVIYITRAQTEVLFFEAQITANYLIQMQRALSDAGIAFISLPVKQEPMYYLAYYSHPMIKSAKPVDDSQIERVIQSSNIGISSISDLKNLGLGPNTLAVATCEAIGHSALYVSKVKRGSKQRLCLRCGKSHPTASFNIEGLGKRKGVVSELKQLTWKDYIHIPAARMGDLVLQLGSTKIQSVVKHFSTLDIGFVPEFPTVKTEKSDRPASKKKKPKTKAAKPDTQKSSKSNRSVD